MTLRYLQNRGTRGAGSAYSGGLRGLWYHVWVGAASCHDWVTVLKQIPSGSVLLDIGPGDGTVTAWPAALALMREKKIRVTAVEMDATNFAALLETIRQSKASDVVDAVCADVLTLDLGHYHAAVFNRSLIEMPDDMLNRLLEANPRLAIYTTQA